MPVLTVEEFRSALHKQSLEDLVRDNVFQGESYFFQHCPADLDEVKATINRRLGSQLDNIVVVGSAKTGFSLDPENFPRDFTDSSDIDVLVVDPVLFDRYWHDILKWHYLQGRYVGKSDVRWAAERKEEIFWGWLEPDRISYRGLLQRHGFAISRLQQISTDWFNAFKALSRVPALRGRDVSGRLYRSWDHALRFHVMGLEKIKTRLRGKSTSS